MFFNAVVIDETKLSTAPLTFSPVPNATKKFSHDAFAVLTLPSMVSALSFAVVPVIPISVCTSCIAVTMSA